MVSKTPTVCFAESLNAAADNQNRIHNQTGADFRYDAAGDMTFDPVTGNSYTYDQENRIVGAAGFTYPFGRRNSGITRRRIATPLDQYRSYAKLRRSYIRDCCKNGFFE